MKKLLFVCTENKLRSATAEAVFSKYEGVEAIGCGTNNDATTTVTGDLLEWADIVFVMEKIHYSKVSKKFKSFLKGKRLICLDIPDVYGYMDTELIRILESKIMKYIIKL